MRMTESWETASQWIVSYHIDPMSLMQVAGRWGVGWGGGGEELTSIFLASLIRRFGCSIKPAPIKYTGCKTLPIQSIGNEINEKEMRKRDLKFLQASAS